MKLERVDPKTLKPHPENPRVHPDAAIGKIRASVEEFGFVNPILISEDGFVLAGHGRLKAALIEKLKEVPVVRLPLAGRDALAYLIADNKLAEDSSWDFGILRRSIRDMVKMGDLIKISGFSDEEVKAILACDALDPESREKSKEAEPCLCTKCGRIHSSKKKK